MKDQSARLEVKCRPGQSSEELNAEQLTEGISSNAFVALLFAQHSGFASGSEIAELVGATQEAVERTKLGGTEQADALLTSQAIALNAVFLEMSRRAALNMGHHLKVTETYMRLALKAQSQCRSTLESLAEIRNPRTVAFVKQANIAAGHQQVNNAPVTSRSDAVQGEARGRENSQNVLLEGGENGQWLDTRAPTTAGRSHPEMAAVAALNGAEEPRGEG